MRTHSTLGGGTFATVLLSTMEAVMQAREEQAREGRSGPLLVNGLFGAVWQAVLDRSEAIGSSAAVLPDRPPASGSGAHP